jgi:hypothetical protein
MSIISLIPTEFKYFFCFPNLFGIKGFVVVVVSGGVVVPHRK